MSWAVLDLKDDETRALSFVLSTNDDPTPNQKTSADFQTHPGSAQAAASFARSAHLPVAEVVWRAHSVKQRWFGGEKVMEWHRFSLVAAQHEASLNIKHFRFV